MADFADRSVELARKTLEQVMSVGIDGLGPFKGATRVAGEARAVSADDEAAIDRLVRLHVRLAATGGGLTGLGGIAILPFTIPANIGSYYVLAARLAAGIADLRGHDVHSEDVRSAAVLVMLGT